MWDWRQLRWLSYVGWWLGNSKTRTGYRMLRTLGILLFLWDVVQVGPELMALYFGLLRNSLKGAVVNLNTVLIGFTCFLKIGGFVVAESSVKWLIARLEEMDERAKNVIPKSDYEFILTRGNKNCLRFVIIIYLFVGTVIHWSVRPLYLLSQGTKAFIIDAWVPWNTDTLKGWAVVYLFQIIHVPSCVLGNLTIDTLYVSILEMILGQIDHLKVALSNLDFTQPGLDYQPNPTLKFCIRYHQDILLVCRRFNKMVRATLFLSIMTSTISLCLFCFELTSPLNAEINRIINLAEIIAFTLAIIFFYCWYCKNVVDQLSEGILRAVYNNNWYRGRPGDKRAMGILCTMALKPFQFGYIVPVDLDTFITVLKSAFSYYNFLKALSVEE